jgi:DNA-directed RNA polymerase specialized sigma24 family protein
MGGFDMAVITIPFDYDPRRDSNCVVPICLNDTDNNGEKIFFGWIEAVVPVQDKLKALSIRVLGDVWRVSELTELTIHHLWHKYRENVGCNPSFRVYATARRTAHGLEDPGARVHLALNISLDAIEEYRRDAVIANTADTERGYRINLDLQRIERKLKELGRRNEIEVYRMLKAGYYWSEIGERVGEHPNTVYRRFRRLLRRIIDIV